MSSSVVAAGVRGGWSGRYYCLDASVVKVGARMSDWQCPIRLSAGIHERSTNNTGMRQELPEHTQDQSDPPEQVDDESTKPRYDQGAQVGQEGDECRGGEQYRDDYADSAYEVC